MIVIVIVMVVLITILITIQPYLGKTHVLSTRLHFAKLFSIFTLTHIHADALLCCM